jgi:hypothetical protein
MVGPFDADGVAHRGGRSARVIFLRTPGASLRKQPNAERPVRRGEVSAWTGALRIATHRPKRGKMALIVPVYMSVSMSSDV